MGTAAVAPSQQKPEQAPPEAKAAAASPARPASWQDAAEEQPPQSSVVSVVRSIAKQQRVEALLRRVRGYLDRVRKWVWHLIEELFEEFQPWLKWIIFDAALTLVVSVLVRHVTPLRPLFEAVGWA